jgi:hypothetical protein
MMIGRNTLVVNTATMKAALQMYLDSQRTAKAAEVLVANVEPEGMSGGFRVTLDSPAPEES